MVAFSFCPLPWLNQLWYTSGVKGDCSLWNQVIYFDLNCLNSGQVRILWLIFLSRWSSIALSLHPKHKSNYQVRLIQVRLRICELWRFLKNYYHSKLCMCECRCPKVGSARARVTGSFVSGCWEQNLGCWKAGSCWAISWGPNSQHFY